MEDNIIYLTQEDIIESHKEGFDTFGGGKYGVDMTCVEKRVVEPQTHYFGVEQYPGLFLKAALYMHHLSSIHCFNDGNKRVAFIATDLFLKFNGYKFKVDQNELYVYCYLIADRKTRPSIESVRMWIVDNVVPFDLEELSDFL